MKSQTHRLQKLPHHNPNQLRKMISPRQALRIPQLKLQILNQFLSQTSSQKQ